jgi:hypothetical protein
MPPKKLPEAPVIFSLKLPVEEDVPQPANGSTEYSEILNAVETSQVSERFNTDTMKDILTRTRSPTYSSNTVCFWCCHTFNWTASILPIAYDAYENMYTCEGHFCSPECGMAYLYADPALPDGLDMHCSQTCIVLCIRLANSLKHPLAQPYECLEVRWISSSFGNTPLHPKTW